MIRGWGMWVVEKKKGKKAKEEGAQQGEIGPTRATGRAKAAACGTSRVGVKVLTYYLV